MADKRRWIRTKPSGLVSRTATLLLGADDKIANCRVVDLSAGGACLELSELVDLPTRFEFIHSRKRSFCRVAWSRGYRIGIMFEATNQRSMIAGGVSRTTKGVSWLSRR
jgi:hypothetical protein